MNIIACDQSTTRFGVAIGAPTAEKPKAFVVKGPGADELVVDRMLSGFGDTIGNYIELTGAKHCIIEQPLMLADRSAHTAAALIMLTGVLRATAHRKGCKVHLAAVSSVRSFFIGQAHLKSDEAKAAVLAKCRALGWNVEDDNAGDAAALWAYGVSLFYPAQGLRFSAKAPMFAEGARV